MRRVLITGGAGFIGSHLCDRLVDRGCEVLVLDDLSSGSAANLARVASKITFLRADVREVGRHVEALQGVDTVFHLAALISGYDSLREPDAYLDVNVGGTLELLRVCAKLDRPRVVFASSSTVYGSSSPDAPARTEDDLPRPASVYALSKLIGEHLLSMYAGVHGFDPVCLRLFNVYGPRQSPSHPYANVTCKFAHAAALGLPVRLYGDGEQSRDFVFVDDVVDAFVKVALGAQAPLYNVGTGTDTSILALLRAAQALASAPLDVERMPPWPNDIRRIRADTSRLRREHGFEAQVRFEEGLARTVAWFRAPEGNS